MVLVLIVIAVWLVWKRQNTWNVVGGIAFWYGVIGAVERADREFDDVVVGFATGAVFGGVVALVTAAIKLLAAQHRPTSGGPTETDTAAEERDG